MSVNEKMTAIADAIRDKTGKTEMLNLDDMADGVNDVYDKGRNDEMCDFWNIVTNNRSRESYERAFSYWGAEYIRPPYKIIPTGNAKTMFGQAYNLKKVEKEYFDFSQLAPSQTVANSGNYSYFNTCSSLEEIEDVGIPAGYYYFTFFKCSNLHTIEVLRFVETTMIDGAFNQCHALRNITIEGIIGQNISFSDSPLAVESIISILTHLKYYSADTANKGKYTLTLKDSCKTLMAQQGAIAELGGKTYDAYIADIGWNLA